jgi:branched-chain amino acid transport system ATP-binding protein
MSVLSVVGLSKSFGGVQAVRAVDFSVREGEFLALIGPNGAGKSTCFNMINGQLKPDAGKILLLQRDIAGLPPREIWRLGVGRTFQIAATFGSLTVVENVQTALISHAGETCRLWRPAAAHHRDHALTLLEQVGMRDAAGMAPRERNDLIALVKRLVVERGVSVLFTEHSMDVVFAFADRIIVMARGRLIADGDARSIRENPQVQEVYFGGGRTFARAAQAGA